MFDRLIDLLVGWAELFKFWEIVDVYERGVVLRLGHFQRELGPGLHWCLPFGIDQVFKDNVVPRTETLGEQSITTRDGKTVVVTAVVTARIHNIVKAILEVEGVDDALKDSCGGEVSRVIQNMDWKDLQADISEALTEACRKQGWRWGIEIMRVQLVDVVACRSLRLWM